MKVAKADKEDLDVTLNFLHACELSLETNRSFGGASNNWKELEKDDQDFIEISKIRETIAESEGIKVDDVDNRILMYEYLVKKFSRASCMWRRVYWASAILIDECCDPTERHLAFYPGFELNNVDREQ